MFNDNIIFRLQYVITCILIFRRIPKKATPTPRRKEQDFVITPLTSVDVPKENFKFERFRKGLSDKDKFERTERDKEDKPKRFGGNKLDRESFERKVREEEQGRQVVLAPELRRRRDTAGGDNNETPAEDLFGGEPQESEPAWVDEGGGGGDSPDICSEKADETNPVVSDDKNAPLKVEEEDTNQATLVTATEEVYKVKEEVPEEVPPAEEGEDDKPKEEDPEVPRENVEVTTISAAVYFRLKDDDNLPDFDAARTIAEVTVEKVAWWLSKTIDSEFESSKDIIHRDDWFKVDCKQIESDSDEEINANKNESFWSTLDFTESEEDEIYLSFSKNRQQKKFNGPHEEACVSRKPILFTLFLCDILMFIGMF